MGYIRESLLKSEKIVYVSKPHWIVFAPAVVALLAALIISVYLPNYFQFDQPIWHGYRFYQLLAILVLLYGVFALLQAILFYNFSEYGITNRRIIMKHGWIQRNAAEIYLNRTEAINVRQTVLGRILNYGTVIVIGTGGSAEYYSNLPNPVRFHRLVQQQLDQLNSPEGGV